MNFWRDEIPFSVAVSRPEAAQQSSPRVHQIMFYYIE